MQMLDLTEFVLNHTIKIINDMIESTWKIKNATATIIREKNTEIALIENALGKDCTEGCNRN